MSEEELEEVIEKARVDRSEILDLRFNKLVGLPESICNLFRLTTLDLHCNQLAKLPESIGNLCNLTALSTEENNLTRLPESIITLSNLTSLNLHFNQLTSLPASIVNLSNLREIYLSDNPWNDASLVLFKLQLFPNLITTSFFDIDSLPRRYWTNLDEWEPKWLLDEENAEIRRVLIQQIGYDRVCQELDAIELNTWREYTLLKIDADIDEEQMVLLKMTCPSTGHIHILRVPPEMTSAEAAITWVNHGIHPDEFTVQT